MPARRPTLLARATLSLPARVPRPSRAALRGAATLASALAVATAGGAAAGEWGPYEVSPGDSLWSLAARHGTTVERIRTMNGLPDDELRAGELLYLPGSHSGMAGMAGTAQSETAADCPPSSPIEACPPFRPPGGYVVQPGESLSVLAARAGTSVADLAARNGLGPDEGLRIGQILLVLPDPGQAGTPAAALSAGAPAPGAPGDGVTPSAATSSSTVTTDSTVTSSTSSTAVTTNSTVTSSSTVTTNSTASAGSAATTSSAVTAGSAALTNPAATPAGTGGGVLGGTEPVVSALGETQRAIRAEAAQQGVDPALALAVASVESGFDPTAVSQVGAVGVMQLMPRTARWIATVLDRPVDRSDPADNIAGGVAFLRFLLVETSGDVPTAVGSYYQGLDSVRRYGFFPDTQEYVGKVIARRAHFAEAP
ncbi:LysM peptidoglycan-binding domain-containing protein [Pseudofrankia asymbiotica]|uniref:LysM domain-containing protein n=1 Tax=Pseudofrankia asymbiotica TaxID=1834516 RepID=A0A1V2I864_9ACTN|nr:LysM peptidoglycan-binding domain-containing protein [Pseudofrankia asymbiotica]ONH28417.1 hypothetical protein BL253_19710 [Pseudofrankia asymbiotica]